MKLNIRKAAVIGAGTMGSGIAAHLANCGLPTLLLDIVPKSLTEQEQNKGLKDTDKAFRNRISANAIQLMSKAKTSPFYDANDIQLLTPGNLEDDFDQLTTVDWIIEVVPEIIEIKKSLFQRLDSIHRPGQLISSNTSGLSLQSMTEGLGQDLKKHTFITHFFNPPRYMHLLELVSSPDTDPEIFQAFARFSERDLGKGTVIAKDTPNFIGNRIGIFDMTYAIGLATELGLTVGEVDAIAGQLVGRPKSAIFRLVDLVGVDIAVHVNNNLYKAIPNDESREIFVPSELLLKMVKNGMLGEKSGKGFYCKSRDDTGKRVIKSLNLKTLEYDDPQRPRFQRLKELKRINDLGDRLDAILGQDDEIGQFIWGLLSHTLCYTANRVPEISDSIQGVDDAMRWGFNWALGPFELWDVIGVKKIVDRLESEGRVVPELVKNLLNSGSETFYVLKKGQRVAFDPQQKMFCQPTEKPRSIHLADLKKSNKVIQAGKTASVIDLGDGVICLESHTKANTLSSKTLEMLRIAVTETEKNHQALVIGNQGSHFCLGADLSEMIGSVMSGNFGEVDKMIQNFQNTMQSIKFSRIPVVTALHGMVLGGGCELAMHSDTRIAAPETYIGLVETGVGLIPAGGGCKEWASRADEWGFHDENIEIFPLLHKVVEMVGMAKTSSSAALAKKMGYLQSSDQICMNPDARISTAAQFAKHSADLGYRPPVERSDIRVIGRDGVAEFRVRMHMWKEGKFISEHDQLIVNKLSYVLCGGDLPGGSKVSEQYLLNLEREAFLSLLGEKKTQARIEHTLKTGKPLRN